MSSFRITSIPVLLLILCALLALAGCNSGRSDMLEDLLAMEPGATSGAEASSERIEELEGKIEEYRTRVEEAVQAAGQLATYYKMLASEYIDAEMYGFALEQLQKAIEIEPENTQLFYLAGVSAGRMAKAAVTNEERRRELLADAEAYYSRAIELDGDHVPSLYGLAVLYVFELDQPLEAVPLLEKVRENEPRNARALMVLGRAHAALGNVDKAAEAYGEAARVTTSDELKAQARENRNQILQGQGTSS